MNYFKRFWGETTGEELTDSWGTSTYYFETDDQGNVLRQVQIFQNGKALKYEDRFIEDIYGSLSDQQLDITDFKEFKIEGLEFDEIWSRTQCQ